MMGSPDTGVGGSSESPNVGAKNFVLFKSRECSQALNLHANPVVTFGYI